MSDAQSHPPFDAAQAHRYFSVECFNRAWELIDQPARTAAENDEMLLRASASLWHWTQRDDCTPRTLSVGYWQMARVHALLNQPEAARHYGELSLQSAANEAPFFLGYAHEALARAANVAGEQALMQHHLDEARQCAVQVAEGDERTMLEKDLQSIK